MAIVPIEVGLRGELLVQIIEAQREINVV